MAVEPRPALLGRKKLVGALEETTSGTFMTTITTGLGANFYNVKCTPGAFLSEGERQAFGNYVGSVDGVVGKQMGDIEFDMDVAPTGPFLTLLTLCGYKATTGTYAPNSDLSTRKTWSFMVWEDGRVKKVAGCSGNVTIDFEAGKKVVAHFKISGVWVAVIDAAMPAQAPINALPYVVLGITLTIGAAAIAHVSKISLDLGAAPEERESVTAAAGIAHYLVGEVEPKATLDPEARKVADQDAYGLFLAGTTAALVIALTAGGHTLTITAGRVQRTKVSDDTRGKRLVDGIDLACRVSSGDDALTLVET